MLKLITVSAEGERWVRENVIHVGVAQEGQSKEKITHVPDVESPEMKIFSEIE